MWDIIKKIVSWIVLTIFTVLVIFLVVIPSPKDIISYAFLSFILLVDGIVIYFLLLPPSKKVRKKKPKTISNLLFFWLLIVTYICIFATACLTQAYLWSSKVLVLVFVCLFAAMGLAAIIADLYLLITHLLLLNCLKHGRETRAQFISAGKSDYFEYGRPQTSSYYMTSRNSVIFEYSVDGQRKTAKSKRVFTLEEMKKLQEMKTFKIRYNKRLAVITEILE